MKLESDFVVERPRDALVEALDETDSFAALFPDTRVVETAPGVRETRTPFRALGQEREIRFVFATRTDGNVDFHKICDGNVWRSLEGQVCLTELEPGITEVSVRMDGRTRSLVPEFTIRGEMETQLERMADAIRERLEGS